jgi:multiple sugar transport system permease protein
MTMSEQLGPGKTRAPRPVPGREVAPRPGHRKRREHAVWMMAPTMVFLLLIVGVPLVIVVVSAFLTINEANLSHWLSAPFAHLANFSAALTGPNVLGVSSLRSIWLSIAFSVLTTAVASPIGFLAALTVHQRSRGRALMRSIYLIPYAIPTFVTALLARIIFLNQDGLLDRVLSDLHLASRGTYWLIGPNAFWAMTATDIWAAWPLLYLMLLAGLQAVPREQLEAATVDGAGTWQRLRHIVMPQLKGVYALAVLLSTFAHFGNFTLPYVMFGTPPPTSVDTLPVNIYFRAFSSFDFGVASATAIVTILVLGIPGVIYMRMTRMTRSQ